MKVKDRVRGSLLLFPRYTKILADPRGCQGCMPPSQSNFFFIFMLFSGKIYQIFSLASSALGLAPQPISEILNQSLKKILVVITKFPMLRTWPVVHTMIMMMMVVTDSGDRYFRLPIVRSRLAIGNYMVWSSTCSVNPLSSIPQSPVWLIPPSLP